MFQLNLEAGPQAVELPWSCHEPDPHDWKRFEVRGGIVVRPNLESSGIRDIGNYIL